MKRKAKKNKNWEVEGYYYDGKNSYTFLRNINNPKKEKKVKGII